MFGRLIKKNNIIIIIIIIIIPALVIWDAVADFPLVAERLARGWRRVDRAVIRPVLQGSPLCVDIAVFLHRAGFGRSHGATASGSSSCRPPSRVVRQRMPHVVTEMSTVLGASPHHRTKSPTDRVQWVETTRQRFQTYLAKKKNAH